MKNDTNSGKRQIYVGIEHFWTHLIGFHGNIPRWGISQLGISLISSHLVCFNIRAYVCMKISEYPPGEYTSFFLQMEGQTPGLF